MKNFRLALLALVAGMLMASCGYPDHLQTLPKETVAVVSFDLAGMAAKGDLHKLQEADFYKKMQAKMGEKDADAAKETDEFLKNPLNYGINFLEPVYLFVANVDSQPSVGFSIALGDADKFKTFISKTAKIEENGWAITSATGYSLLATSDADFAWNDFALIIMPKLGSKENTNLLTSIFADKDKDQSVVSQPGFKSYYKNTKDISGWMGLGFITSLADVAKMLSPEAEESTELAEAQKQMEQLKEASIQFHVTFNDDEIHTEYITDLPEELKKMYNSEELLRSGSPEKISSLIGGKELGVFAMSLNLQNYLKTITESPALSAETKESMGSYIGVVQQFIAPFDGDLLISVLDIKEIETEVTEQIPVESADDDLTASTDDEYEYEFDWDMEYKDTTYMKKETMPIFLAATTLNDESFGFLGMMLGKDKPTSGKVKSTDLYGTTLYTTIKEKVLIVSNDKALVDGISDGSYKGDKGSLMAKGASDHGVYVYANLDLQKYPKLVQDAVGAELPPAEKEVALQFFTMFDHIEMYNNEDFSAVVSLKLKPNGHNSLYTILEYAGNAAYASGALN